MHYLVLLILLISSVASAQNGVIDWGAGATGPGGTWASGNTVSPAALNEIKTEVDALGAALTVNITGSSNPCSQVQTLLDQWNLSDQDIAIKIVGKANVDFADLVDKGDHRVCWYIGDPASNHEQTEGWLDIEFAGAHLTYTASASDTESVVLVQLGAKYDDPGANTGSINGSVNLRGSLFFEIFGDRDSGWVQGDVPELPFGASGFIPTSSIVNVFANDFHGDARELNITTDGSMTDYDNVAYYFANNHSSRWGTLRSRDTATALMVEGAHEGAIIESIEFDQNDGVNISLAGRHTPGFWRAQDLTQVDETNRGLVIAGGVSQGGKMGNLIVYHAFHTMLRDIHFEGHSVEGQHAIIVGAGVCSLDATKTCAVDGQCGAGTCIDVTTSGQAIRDLVFDSAIGPEMDGNNGFSGFALGPGFNEVTNVPFAPLMTIRGSPFVTSGNPFISVFHSSADGLIRWDEPHGLQLFGYPRALSNPGGVLNLTAGLTLGQFHKASYYQWHTITNSAGASDIRVTYSDVNLTIPPIRFCDTGGAGKLLVDPDSGTTRSILFPGLTVGAGKAVISPAGTDVACITLVPISSTQYLATEISGTWTAEP